VLDAAGYGERDFGPTFFARLVAALASFLAVFVTTFFAA